jgi:hypothetical protein
MKKALLLLLPGMWLACTPDDKKVPDDILPVDKMKLIVWDMTQAGEYAAYRRDKDTAHKPLNTGYFNEVLKIYHLDKKDYFKSFDYYQSHPVLNKILFDSVAAYGDRKRFLLYKKIQ